MSGKSPMRLSSQGISFLYGRWLRKTILALSSYFSVLTLACNPPND